MPANVLELRGCTPEPLGNYLTTKRLSLLGKGKAASPFMIDHLTTGKQIGQLSNSFTDRIRRTGHGASDSRSQSLRRLRFLSAEPPLVPGTPRCQMNDVFYCETTHGDQ